MKTVDFSLTIAASDLKDGRSRHLISLCRNVSIEGQCHFLTLAQGYVHTKIQTRFSQKLLCRFGPNSYESFQVQGTINFMIWSWTHDQDGRHAHIW